MLFIHNIQHGSIEKHFTQRKRIIYPFYPDMGDSSSLHSGILGDRSLYLLLNSIIIRLYTSAELEILPEFTPNLKFCASGELFDH